MTGGSINDSFLVSGVAFKKTFSYAGFEQQPKKFTNPKIIILKIELELKSEKENAEIRISNVEDFQSIVDAEWQIIYEKLQKIHDVAPTSSSPNSPSVTSPLSGSQTEASSAQAEYPTRILTESPSPPELYSRPLSTMLPQTFSAPAVGSRKSKLALRDTTSSKNAQTYGLP